MIMKKLNEKMMLVGIVALIALISTTAVAQSAPPELPKVGEIKGIAIAYTNDGRGKISAADKNGLVQQYLEVWENQSAIPNVVTYMLIGTDGSAFSVTWGRGPLNTKAFRCLRGQSPEFGEKSFWVATVNDGKLGFEEIKDESIKGLFDNLTQARRDWKREVNAANQRYNANTTQQNILFFLKEKNRKKWLEQGWLRPATGCVQHF
jgi:hypothetical protein